MFEGSLVLVAAVVGWFLPIPPWRQIVWSWKGAGWGLAACAPLLAVMLVLRQLRSGPIGRLNRLVDQIVVPMFGGLTAVDFALISIVAGFGEEMLFRGVIQTTFVGWFGLVAGVAIASVLFGLAHIITPTYAVLAAAIGAYLGWLFWLSEDLLAPIIAHAVYDFTALVYLTWRIAKQSSTGVD